MIYSKKNLIKILSDPPKLQLKQVKKNLIAAQLLKQKEESEIGSANVDLVAKGHRRTVHFIKRGKYLIDEPQITTNMEHIDTLEEA